MKTNLYYRTVFRRRNVLKESLFAFFFAISSWPRLVLEVFIRRNMGERYFSFASAVTLFTLLAIAPIIAFITIARGHYAFGVGIFFKYYLTYYVFLAAFLYMAIQRRNESRRLPSVFDFKRFSETTGDTHPDYLYFITGGKPTNMRTVETKLEPRVFFFIGFLLALMSQPVGTLLMQCSLIYALSYRAAYYRADQLVMDKIDEMICNEEMTKSLIEGRDASETRGFRFMGRRPASVEDRQRLADLFMNQDETVEVF